MPLNIYTGNRMERLAEALAGVLRTPLSSPFATETIVVQSRGMQRWLAMELAGKLGIWANCDYPFPNRMIWQLFNAALPEVPDESLFSPEVMTWKIMALLPGFLKRHEFAPVRHYLEGDGDGLKRLQLAGRIADTFDQYTVFRPEMLLQWEENQGGEWQELLWRELASRGGEHRARLRLHFFQRLAGLKPGEGALPERITVFGISYLPRYHMEILAAVAGRSEVNLFLLSPCREYWGDIVPAREKARRNMEEREYLVEGNPLLASLGKLGRDFSEMVMECDGVAAVGLDLYEEPGEGSLLASIQSDILNLAGGEGRSENRPIAEDDRSVQIHSCHSPLREIEVLHDNLLDLLEREKGLNPRDIVVMTPDIETYAPYISMVFEEGRDQAAKIPYSIADRSLVGDGVIAGVVMKLLELPGSRLTATYVFDILESLPVRRRFGIDGQDLETIRSWIGDTRIRWGADETHRVGLGLPPYRENSWAAGLDRLLLGYAMAGEGDLLFNGILPCDGIEGENAATLGKFAEFISAIMKAADQLAGKRALTAWHEALRAMIDDFVAADDESAFELATVCAVVDEMGAMAEQAGFKEEVELSLVRSWLSSRLAAAEKGLGFMTGGVTFCAMLPMRSIPFRVVALVGMSDNAFPRRSRPPGFDLVARNPRPGDRSLRDEDRYLFLECLLSARRYLYISYVGQSIRDNSTIPPSVLVSEFLDAIDGAFHAGGMKTEERLVTRHRLQPFSRSYFSGDPRLFSYSNDNCAALVEAARAPGVPGPFMVAPLDEPPDEMRNVTLAQLIRFFANPARYLLENQLRIRLADVSAPLDEREPFAVEGLDYYCLSQELLERRLKGENAGEFLAVARCRGILPPGRHGVAVFAGAVADTDPLVARVAEETVGRPPLTPFCFEEPLGEFRLTGTIDRIWPDRKISCRCARIKAKDRMRGWIEHLVLNAFAPEGYPAESLLLMKDAGLIFGRVESAAEILRSILAIYWQGLKMPLRFFPESSLEYVLTGGDLERARRKWDGGFSGRGEGEDPYFRTCFGGEDDPFTGDFVTLARELFTPMVEHIRS